MYQVSITAPAMRWLSRASYSERSPPSSRIRRACSRQTSDLPETMSAPGCDWPREPSSRRPSLERRWLFLCAQSRAIQWSFLRARHVRAQASRPCRSNRPVVDAGRRQRWAHVVPAAPPSHTPRSPVRGQSNCTRRLNRELRQDLRRHSPRLAREKVAVAEAVADRQRRHGTRSELDAVHRHTHAH